MPLADRLLLGIDQGTSSTKALLVDGDRAVRARSSVDLGAAHPRPGWVEQSATEIWDSVRQAVAQCVPPHAADQVVAVGLSTQRESVVLWDRASGEPVSPLVSWQDRRTSGLCEEMIDQGAGDTVWSRSGLPLDPMFSALKARWLLDAHDPDRSRSRRGDLCLGTIDSWLLSRLDGSHVSEVGNASRTQLMNVGTGQWDDELLALFDIPRAVLPHVLPSTGPFPALSGLPPVPDGVPVRAVLGDSHAALFAHAGWREGVVKATYGTGSSVMAVGAAGDVRSICRTIAWDLGQGNVAAVEGNIRAAGRTLTWLADLLGISTEELVNLASGSASEGVHVVPAFGGLGAPWWQPDAVTVISGATLATGRAELAAAALESVALQVEDVVTAVEAVVGPVATLLADGGLTRSDRLMQLQADVSGRDVVRASHTELSALGVAELAGVSAGLLSMEQLSARRPEGDRFGPQDSPARRTNRLAAWHEAVSRAHPPERRAAASPTRPVDAASGRRTS